MFAIHLLLVLPCGEDFPAYVLRLAPIRKEFCQGIALPRCIAWAFRHVLFAKLNAFWCPLQLIVIDCKLHGSHMSYHQKGLCTGIGNIPFWGNRVLECFGDSSWTSCAEMDGTSGSVLFKAMISSCFSMFFYVFPSSFASSWHWFVVFVCFCWLGGLDDFFADLSGLLCFFAFRDLSWLSREHLAQVASLYDRATQGSGCKWAAGTMPQFIVWWDPSCRHAKIFPMASKSIKDKKAQKGTNQQMSINKSHLWGSLRAYVESDESASWCISTVADFS